MTTKTYELPEKIKAQVAKVLIINESEITSETVHGDVFWINTSTLGEYAGRITKTGNLKKHSVRKY